MTEAPQILLRHHLKQLRLPTFQGEYQWLATQYFPKGTDLSRHGTNELRAVAHALNTRPRKTLGWQTPAEALDQVLKQDIIESVATTG